MKVDVMKKRILSMIPNGGKYVRHGMTDERIIFGRGKFIAVEAIYSLNGQEYRFKLKGPKL